MIKKSFYFFIIIISINIIGLAQESSTDEQPEENIVSIESKQTYENVTLNDITKKEEEILNLINQINENTIKANTSNSLKAKKTILLQVDELKANLKNLMKEYSEMVNAFNERLANSMQATPSNFSIPDSITDIQLENLEKELKKIAQNINEKASLANRELTEENKRNYIQQIEQLKIEYFAKKAKYLKLVNEYNKRLQEALKLNEEQASTSP